MGSGCPGLCEAVPGTGTQSMDCGSRVDRGAARATVRYARVHAEVGEGA